MQFSAVCACAYSESYLQKLALFYRRRTPHSRLLSKTSQLPRISRVNSSIEGLR